MDRWCLASGLQAGAKWRAQKRGFRIGIPDAFHGCFSHSLFRITTEPLRTPDSLEPPTPGAADSPSHPEPPDRPPPGATKISTPSPSPRRVRAPRGGEGVRWRRGERTWVAENRKLPLVGGGIGLGIQVPSVSKMIGGGCQGGGRTSEPEEMPPGTEGARVDSLGGQPTKGSTRLQVLTTPWTGIHA